jgi:hypothetical protein
MDVNTFIQSVSGVKGANLKATWVRPMKVRKGVEAVIEKKTSAIIRTGVDYDNIQTVKEGRADGTLPEKNEGLPWGQWATFPYHITHKDTDYLRLYPASGLEFKPEVHYILNGQEVGKEIVEPLCLASEFKVNEEKPTCFTIKAETLVSIR